MDWHSIGYADGLRACLRIEAQTNYPTQDKHSPVEETKYLAGYHEAIREYSESGIETMRHYLTERAHA